MWYPLLSENDDPKQAPGPIGIFIPTIHSNYSEALGADALTINPQDEPFILVQYRSSIRFEDSLYRTIQNYIVGEIDDIKVDANLPQQPVYLLCFKNKDNINYFINEVITKPAFGRIQFSKSIMGIIRAYEANAADPKERLEAEAFGMALIREYIAHHPWEQNEQKIRYARWHRAAETLNILNDERYQPLWDQNPDETDLAKTMRLFWDYCKESQSDLFRSKHLRRHHANDVRNCLNENRFETASALLALMKTLSPSANGSLTKRITYAKYRIAKAAYENAVAPEQPAEPEFAQRRL